MTMTIQAPQDALKVFGRSLASSVFVVTAADLDGAPHGATISACTSLSLDPALILICLAGTSQTLNALRNTGHFRVHLLADDQAEVSRAFASRERAGYDQHLDEPDHGVPILSRALAAARCRLVSETSAGDHVIVVGALEEVAASPGSPLLYHRGAYAALPAATVRAAA